MRYASYILILVDIFVSLIYKVLFLSSLLRLEVGLIYGILNIIISAIAISNLKYNKKIHLVGVLTMFLASPLGGIFYLCWNPEK